MRPVPFLPPSLPPAVPLISLVVCSHLGHGVVSKRLMQRACVLPSCMHLRRAVWNKGFKSWDSLLHSHDHHQHHSANPSPPAGAVAICSSTDDRPCQSAATPIWCPVFRSWGLGSWSHSTTLHLTIYPWFRMCRGHGARSLERPQPWLDVHGGCAHVSMALFPLLLSPVFWISLILSFDTRLARWQDS